MTVVDTPAERRSYVHNPRLQFWVPCVDHREASAAMPPIALTRPASPPRDWPESLLSVLGRLRETYVGRALVRHLRLRTTIYYLRNTWSAEVDTFPEDDHSTEMSDPCSAGLRAASHPMRAMIEFDPDRPARHTAGGLLKAPETMLAHELAHAIAITHGCFRMVGPEPPPQLRAPAFEEAYAVVIENMFRDEARFGLRATYDGDDVVPHAGLPTPESTGIPVHAIERAAVLRFRRAAPALVSELERIPEEHCRYNPFRALRGDALFAWGDR